MTLYEFLTSNCAALLSGSLRRFQRQWRQRKAGLLTNALVALGASLLASLSSLGTQTNDHTQMAARVITGIGFPGAGLVITTYLEFRLIAKAITRQPIQDVSSNILNILRIIFRSNAEQQILPRMLRRFDI